VALRIVQLTDLHLGPRLGDGRWAAFEALLANLPGLVGDFDRLVLTGDLAKRGQLVVYQALRTLLEPWLPKVRLVPGNHDHAHLLRQVFADRFSAGAPKASFVEDIGGVRLIGLDSSRPWRISGALGPEQLAWLHGVLDASTPSLVFLHHPPVSVGAWWLDKDRLRDRSAFFEVIRDRGVIGVFSGHVHQDAEGRLGAVPVWTAPSTAYQFKPGALIPRRERKAPGFRLIEVAEGTLSTAVLRHSQ
jgi:3',5'-cyclic-AMP phosphodiesterase